MYHLYTTYILPIGWFYGTYHLLREPETTIDKWLISHWGKPTSTPRIHSEADSPLKTMMGPWKTTASPFNFWSFGNSLWDMWAVCILDVWITIFQSLLLFSPRIETETVPQHNKKQRSLYDTNPNYCFRQAIQNYHEGQIILKISYDRFVP